MNKEEIKEGANTLFDNKEQILATKKLFQIHQMDPSLSPKEALATERIIVGNFNYLTEKGKMSRDEYYSLFQKCEDKKDFAELALATRDFLVETAQKYIEEHPDLPENGDSLNPGKGNIRTGIMWDEAGKKSILKRSGRGEKILVIDMGGPALDETPEWLLVIKENEMKMSDVYAMLEEGANKGAKESPKDEAIGNGREGIHKGVEAIMDSKNS